MKEGFGFFPPHLIQNDLYLSTLLIRYEKIIFYNNLLPGFRSGFKTKADAEKVAKLIITKIKKGEMPPSVTPEELKKLNVL